jgi:uncharacterized protein YdcH (DUF465 family)
MKPMTKRFQLLKEKHQELDDIIDEMNDRRFLSSKERDTLSVLKVQRLQLKDSMRTLRLETSGISMVPPKFELK